ncbi:MAG: hypothetical protein JXA07_15855 [Spirochaetes bacterium]|nr:hypothetical protein [Spirochaetota bacterium]
MTAPSQRMDTRMHTDIITLRPDAVWTVLFRDEGGWRAGVYLPEHRGPDGIEMLEKHSCPELFVCLGGRMGLLLSDGSSERAVELTPHQAVMVSDYHNGFSIDPGGFFLVVERTAFSTDYIDRKTGMFIKRIDVKPEYP